MRLNTFSLISPHEYIGEIDAPINPKRPGHFLAMWNATADPLPNLSKGEVAVRDAENTKWTVVEDARGDAWDVRTKELVPVVEVGPLPDNLTKLKPQKFDEWQGGKWENNTRDQLSSDISAVRQADRKIMSGQLSKPVEFDGVLFDYSASAKASILETIEEGRILGFSDEESTGWRLLDNTVRQTSLADLKGVVKIGALRRRDVNDQYTAWSQGDMSQPLVLLLDPGAG